MLEKAVANLVDLSFERRKAVLDKHEAAFMSPIQFAKEYCTISIGVPRMSGKTSFIADHAECDDAIIVYNNAAAMYYRSKRNLSGEVFTLINLATLGRLGRRCGRYHRIYLDEITNTKDCGGLDINKTIDLIYEFFTMDERQTFIFLHT